MNARYDRIATIPNFLTVLRILASPLIYFFIKHNSYNLAFFLFLISGITDWLDGFIARKFSMESTVGRYIDPIADKIFTFFSYFAIYQDIKILFWIVILRDFLIIFAVIYSKIVKLKLEVKPIFISKLNTTFLSLLPFFWLFGKMLIASYGGAEITCFIEKYFFNVINFFSILILITTALSFYGYAKIFFSACKVK